MVTDQPDIVRRFRPDAAEIITGPTFLGCPGVAIPPDQGAAPAHRPDVAGVDSADGK